jgi:hypothetical protein
MGGPLPNGRTARPTARATGGASPGTRFTNTTRHFRRSTSAASTGSSSEPGATSGLAIRGAKPESLFERLTRIAIAALCAFAFAVAWLALVDLLTTAWRWLQSLWG